MAEDGVQIKEYANDENKERGNWGSKLDFILSCTGYAVGLGNVWRFPYLTYRNGGGAFLIPYFVMLVFAGLPIFFLEISFGQYCSEGPVTAWKSVPMMRGIGYGMLLANYFGGISYNIIITYSLYYLFSSFTSMLPWVGCNHSWNSIYCSDLFDDCVANKTSIIVNNGTCVPLDSLNDTSRDYYKVSVLPNGSYDISNYMDPLGDGRERSVEEFWINGVLRESPSMNETGTIVWQLALTLLLAWIIVFLCLIKGIKSSGKVVYFTATFPYLVLIILLVRGLTLPGYYEGIKFFITPDVSQLAESRVWLDAAVQIFYSLSAAWGGLLTLASYNKFHNNCYFDSILVPAINSCTSLLAGFVIFSIIGFMAHELDLPVSEVAESGFGLAFIAYPEAVARMPISPLWAILFFLMLLTLGLDSEFVIIESVVTAIVDDYPDKLRKHKTKVTFCACVVGYLIGLICVTNAGGYWASLLDSYSAGFPIIVFAILESVGISWIYGAKRFTNDIRSMVGDAYIDFLGGWPFKVWPLMWSMITPAILMFVLMFSFLNWEEPEYNGPYPVWARIIGWLISVSCVVWIPVIMVYEFFRAEGNLQQRWKAMSSPTDNWGPALQQFRDEAWEVHKAHGTTMGGALKLPGAMPVQYTPDGEVGLENIAYE
ncbi:sodium- and chloride-dependent glycine transporter 2-like [Amphiura filiformis]|uniref:sodium- and chloride-dependent glycine transporter 2-like n=1 Tax=Amphiura filiformis TaxID=82378 RepID=UPI003B219B21